MKTVWFVFVAILLFGWQAIAADYRGAEMVKVAAGDTVSSDLFAGSRSVYVDGVVEGDVYAGCETITVNGDVQDDLFGFCKQLSVRGTVGDMVVFFGQTMVIEGSVGGDVLAFGGEVRIADGAAIDGNLYVGTGNVVIDGGSINGVIKGGAGTVFLNGTVGQDVDLEARHVRFGADYRAAGGTHLTLKRELDKTKAGNVPDNLQVTIKKRKMFFQSGFFYWSMIAMFITGVLLIALFKNFSRDVVDFARQNMGKNLGIGALSLLAIPIAVIILLVLVVTIPVSLIILALFLVALYIGKVLSALFIGNYLLEAMRKNGAPVNLFAALAIGIILVVLLPQIPFIGWLIKLAIYAFGMGVILVYLWKFKEAGSTQTT